MTTEHEVEAAEWAPPLASRSDRRACAKTKHQGMSMIKYGYCAVCGVKVTA